MNLTNMITSFLISAIVLYFINVYFDIGRRRVNFRQSFKYLPNIVLAVLMSASINIFHWGIIITMVLWWIMKFLLDECFG